MGLSCVRIGHFRNKFFAIVHGHDVSLVVHAIGAFLYRDTFFSTDRARRDAAKLIHIKFYTAKRKIALLVGCEATAGVTEEIRLGIPICRHTSL